MKYFFQRTRVCGSLKFSWKPEPRSFTSFARLSSTLYVGCSCPCWKQLCSHLNFSELWRIVVTSCKFQPFVVMSCKLGTGCYNVVRLYYKYAANKSSTVARLNLMYRHLIRVNQLCTGGGG